MIDSRRFWTNDIRLMSQPIVEKHEATHRKRARGSNFEGRDIG